MLAVKRLADMQRSSDGRGSLRKKPPPITQQQEVISMDSPPLDEVIMSPKMSTFQDSELSSELQNAITHPGQEVRVQRTRTLSKDQEEMIVVSGGPPKKEARTIMEVKESPQQQVPHLCLPPEAELEEAEGAEPSALKKKRTHSLNRYAVSDGECDERVGGGEGGGGGGGRGEREAEAAVAQGSTVVTAEGGKYATVTHRVSRSHSVRNQEKAAGRSQAQSFALRQKKKGPPPPPPKRSSSAISSSNSNLTEANMQQQTHTTTGGMLDVPYHQQRRASDLGMSVETAAVETNSMGSVRSIAAMLEMSSIGGGAKGMALQKNYLQVGKTREAIGLDGEVVNRRRTISGPVTELVEAARREQPAPLGFAPTSIQPQPQSSPPLVNSSSPHPPSSPLPCSGGSGSSSEHLPFAEEGSLTIRRQARGEGEGQGDGDAPPGDGAFTLEDTSEATGTLKRRPRISKSHPNGSDFTLQESSTVKRRPKSRDKEPEGYAEMAAANGETVSTEQPNNMQPVPYQNGTATVKRRPTSDAGVTEQPQPQAQLQNQPQHHPQHQHQPQQQVTTTPRRDSVDQGAPAANEGGPVRKPKPPVSPKPVVAQIKRQGGPQTPPQAAPNKRVPLPGPGTPGSPGTQSVAEQKTTVSILDDIGSMFDDLADQLDAMLE
ncbi:hypothetical protein GOODEAATRI_004790 [Goodea atripinnis]|uniref:Caskin C-terminal domain-containing protein n=1 Tax=Goodea atripinnis TaxID=208336 RepID=A0ABV0NHI2_9TELE